MTAKTATEIRRLSGFTGDARLFKVSPPMRGFSFCGEEPSSYDYVIASATIVGTAPETYLFPSNEAGEVVSWTELPASQKGTLSHGDVFRDAGYVVNR